MQRTYLRRLRQFYSQLAVPRLLRSTDQLGQPMQLVTIRHARPNLDKLDRYTVSQLREFTHAYDTVPIHPVEQPVFELLPGEVSRVYSSTLPRAEHTAQQLFGEHFTVQAEAMFVELEREAPLWPGQLRLPLRYWQTIMRLQYFSGRRYHETEDFAAARRRMRRAADFLEAAAQRDGAVVLVAHGFFNLLLTWVLRQRGWHRVRRSGLDNLGVTIYAKQR